MTPFVAPTIKNFDFQQQNFLCIEYSGFQLSFAFFQKGVCVAYEEKLLTEQGSEYFLPLLEKIFLPSLASQNNGLAISVGPGSFTALRISLASCYALAQAHSWPVFGVNSLEVLLWSFLNPEKEQEFLPSFWSFPKRVACLIKAYQNEFFVAIFQIHPPTGGKFPLSYSPVVHPQALSLDQTLKKLQPNDLLVGSGVEVLFSSASDWLKQEKIDPTPKWIHPNAKGVGFYWLNRGQAVEKENLPQPLYLTPTYAEKIHPQPN